MCEMLTPLGGSCATDADCASGACFPRAALSYSGTGEGSVCSAPCCADKDCGIDAHCLVTAQGARGCVASIGTDAPGACADNHDCDGQQICRMYTNVMTGDTTHARTVCTSGMPDTVACSNSLCILGYCPECDSGNCLGGECAISCRSGTDCASGICFGGICHDTCRTSADCPTDMRCGIGLYMGDAFQTCVYRQSGRSPAGSSCTAATDCADSYCSSEGTCTAVCCTDADCGSGVCRPVNNSGWEMRCLSHGTGPS
jgi:hypothetical protein